MASAMDRRWNKVFAAGIMWDPHEPLPPEFEGYYDHDTNEKSFLPGNQAAHHVKLAAFHAHVDGPSFLSDHGGGRRPFPTAQPPIHGPGPIQAAATWLAAPVGTSRPRILPRFTVQKHGRNILPPLFVTVDASIVQDTARVAVTQLFWNDSAIPIKEAAFTFPLPAGCTVTDFSCRIGTNKIIRGAVKPREEAREAFKQHIHNSATVAGLLEQDTPEIFTTSLGNIPKKTKVKVSLTYIAVLKHHFADSKNAITLTLPTSIAPRYGDAPEEYNDAASANVSQGLRLEIEVIESEKITSITSPSHPIAVDRRQGPRAAENFADLAGEGRRSNVETATVKLENGRLFLDKDFVLDIVTTPDNDAESPQAWLEEHPTLPNHKALMLTLPPGFMTTKTPPTHQTSEILFLADRSGSMHDKIPALISAMQFFLKGIPEGRKFNIWCFGSSYCSWLPQSVDYTEGTLAMALSWVESNFRANMGGTELLGAVEAIVATRDRSLMTDVIVLTDGQTWRMDQTLEFIQKTRGLTEGRVRFFALGIGRAVSHALVDGIAKAGGGYAEVVQEASQGGWEDRVVSMAQAALMTSHFGPLHVVFDIQDGQGNMTTSTLADAKRSPADTSAISPFDRSRIYFVIDSLGKSETIKSVRIEAAAGKEIKSLVIPVNALEKQDTTLHKLAARAILDDLERRRSHIHLGPNRPTAGSWQETHMVRKEAEEVACKWSLVSKWTSFFLAEEPCPPTEEDPSMAGVVEVKDAPGNDLLQPRGPNPQVASLPPAELDASRPSLSSSSTPSSTSISTPTSSIVRVEELMQGQYAQLDYSSGEATGNYYEDSLPATTSFPRGMAAPVMQQAFRRPPTMSRPFEIPPPPAPNAGERSFARRVFTPPSTADSASILSQHPTVSHTNGNALAVDATYEPHSSAYGEAAVRMREQLTMRMESQPRTHDYDFLGRAEEGRRKYAGERSIYDVPRGASAAEQPQPPWHADGNYFRAIPKARDSNTTSFETVQSAEPPQSRPRLKTYIPETTTSEWSDVHDSVPSDTTPNAGSRSAARPAPPKPQVPVLRLGGDTHANVSSDATISAAIAARPAPPKPESPVRRLKMRISSRRAAAPFPEVQAAPMAAPPSVGRPFIPPSDDGDDDILARGDPDPLPGPQAAALGVSDADFNYTHYHTNTNTDTNPQETKRRLEKQLVTILLTFQQWNGAIDFSHWDTAAQVLGKEITDALEDLHAEHMGLESQVLWTAAVHVLLERDLHSCKALWALMALKAASYVQKAPLPADAEGLDVVREVRGRLEGLRLPIHQEEKKGVDPQAGELEPDNKELDVLNKDDTNDDDDDNERTTGEPGPGNEPMHLVCAEPY